MNDRHFSYRTMVALAFVSVALGTQAVRGDIITTQYGDLILGFQVAQSYGSNPGLASDLEIDLGPVTQSYGGTNVIFGALAVQDLIDTYGASWSTRTDLFWGAVATANGTTGNLGFPANTLWATDPPGQDPWVPGTSGAQGISRANISTMIPGGAAGVLNGQTSTTNSPHAAAINSSLSGSWTFQDSKVAGTSFSYFNPTVDASANIGGGQLSMDLYELQPGNGRQAGGDLDLECGWLELPVGPLARLLRGVAIPILRLHELCASSAVGGPAGNGDEQHEQVSGGIQPQRPGQLPAHHQCCQKHQRRCRHVPGRQWRYELRRALLTDERTGVLHGDREWELYQ